MKSYPPNTTSSTGVQMKAKSRLSAPVEGIAR